jgi:phosphoribosylformimino-5-aminoimidazole carboxamide ribotide isomerase
VVIVPSVDVRAGRVAFQSETAADVDPRALAASFVAGGADELHLVDLDGAERGDYANFTLLAAIARESAIPCRLAGGLASIDRARAALDAGFAGVLFSSAVFGDGALFPAIGRLSDGAIVEIESRDGLLAPRGGGADLVLRATGRDSVAAAVAAVDAGIRSLYVIELGAGSDRGPAVGLLRAIRKALGSRAAGIALHTGGGVRDLADVTALAQEGVTSVVLGRALAAQRFTIAEARAAAR